MSDEQVIEYLRSRRRAPVPHDTVRSVMAAIEAAPARRAWFAVPLTAAATAAAAVVAVVIGLGLLGGPRIGPPGLMPDCAADPVGLLRYAVDRLETAEGYRWTQEEQLWGFDPAFPVSAADPHYGWSGYAAEGAYLAPDRMRLAVTSANAARPMAGPLGFEALIHL